MKWKLRVKHSYCECLRPRINTLDFIIRKKVKATFIEIYYIIIIIIIIIITIIIIIIIIINIIIIIIIISMLLKWSQNPLQKGKKIKLVETRYFANCISNINFISSKAMFGRIITY